MNQDLALRILASIMGWDDARARQEYAWLRLISRLKYDQYRDFLAGVRFVESLADWLQQFEEGDREIAYHFVRQELVYIGPSEFHHLVELSYPDAVQPIILKAVARQLKIPPYLVWSKREAIDLYRTLLRSTLFLGLSDGARMDAFRRANAGIISNEQVVGTIQVEDEKWEDLLEDLQKQLGSDARFKFIFAIDDFTASGTSLIRKPKLQWKGKLCKLWKSISDKLDTHFTNDYVVCVHHYIASAQATEEIIRREDSAKTECESDWFREVMFTFGMQLPTDLPVTDYRHADLRMLITKYYDPILEVGGHTEESGVREVHLGYGGCALPVILEHNTPNNSIALLWAETNGECGKAMRPLFRRRQRHS